MASNMTEIAALETEIMDAIGAAEDEAALEAARVGALGKKGAVSALLATLGTMPPAERRDKGPLINGLRDRVAAAVTARREILKTAALDRRLNTETVDVTLPVLDNPADIGRVHPVSQVMDELTTIFTDMGFAVAEGPDIETDDYNFGKLNFPEGHPARDMHDTFFFNPKPDGSRLLLRTHTSPVQVRTMLAQKPPIRVICPGRTYRCDSDQTHTPVFHQVEGLVVDKGSHLGHLKWILAEFCKAFFEVDDVKMRFRPSFFPFTEPSLEVDIQCRRDKGEIRFGEGDDWMEILGCGMVHPNVLRNCGIDPDVYQGFAWGVGVDRIAMLKYGMPDLRAFFEADIRWLAHYGFRPLDMPTLAGGLSGEQLATAQPRAHNQSASPVETKMIRALQASIEAALKRTLGAHGFDHVEEVREDVDHDGEPAVFVTAVLRPQTVRIPGDVSASASVAVAQALKKAGDDRLSYLYIRRPDDERPVDETSTASSS
jgi:phenylalanyl-tRNA synthetase alpha chain